MNWNKEKLTFVLALVAAVGALGLGFLSGSLGGESYENLVRDPAPGSYVARDAEPIDWLSVSTTGESRDPFLPISEWKPAVVDMLPPPPTPPLMRRIPVPGHLAESVRALPVREVVRPEEVEGEN